MKPTPVPTDWHKLHIGHHPSLDMRQLYAMARLVPTSTAADTVLIRSHIAYCTGPRAADFAIITPSRGHSYAVDGMDRDVIVRIVDHYDHRNGVTGWTA